MNQVRIEPITRQTLNHAAQLVTESFDLESRRGEREDIFINDWRIEYERLVALVDGLPYVGLVGYQNYNQAVALSVISAAEGYMEGAGIWAWFFISPRSKVQTFPLRMAAESLRRAESFGLREIISFSKANNADQLRLQKALGARPVSVEYRVSVKDISPKVMSHVKSKQSSEAVGV